MGGLYKSGLGLIAVGALAWIPGFLTFDMMLPALGCVAMGAGAIAAAVGRRAGGLVAAGAGAAVWVITFVLAGFSFLDVASALLLALGFTLAALVRGHGAALASGIAIAGVGNLWYLVNNTFLGGTPAFMPGNWIFLAGTAVAVVATLRGAGADEPEAVPA